LDSRPSDAIALALRVEAPVLVNPQLLAKSEPDPQEIDRETEKTDGQQRLENMKPEDFGKYKM
jgi:bifunctional DNase/RNase